MTPLQGQPTGLKCVVAFENNWRMDSSVYTRDERDLIFEELSEWRLAPSLPQECVVVSLLVPVRNMGEAKLAVEGVIVPHTCHPHQSTAAFAFRLGGGLKWGVYGDSANKEAPSFWH